MKRRELFARFAQIAQPVAQIRAERDACPHSFYRALAATMRGI
jgi:hypothetical protein